jgi:hypothetical protein
MQKLTQTILLIGGVFALIIGVIWVKQFLQIDECLDSGGRWNYDLKECEHLIDLTKQLNSSDSLSIKHLNN